MRWWWHRGDRSATSPAAPVITGSDADPSAERLRQRVHEQTDAFRAEASIDFTVAGTLAEMGQLDAAAERLARQHEALLRLRGELESALADAAVEREAERIVAACVAELAGQPPYAPQGADPLTQRVRDPLPHLLLARSRRSLAGAAAAIALAVAVVVPALRSQEPPVLTVADAQAAELQLAAARAQLDALQLGASAPGAAVAEEARQLHAAIRELPDAALAHAEVRAQLRDILQREGDTLSVLVGRVPDAQELLAEVRRLGARLELDLEIPDVEQPTVPLPATEVAPPAAPRRSPSASPTYASPAPSSSPSESPSASPGSASSPAPFPGLPEEAS